MADSALPELPYERIAMAGGEMPHGLQYHDQITFQALRNLYRDYKKNTIDRETATREKAEILREWDNLKFMCDLFRENVEMTKRTEIVRSEYRNTRSLEAADWLCDILEGRKINVR
jgi:hypothetical protein